MSIRRFLFRLLLFPPLALVGFVIYYLLFAVILTWVPTNVNHEEAKQGTTIFLVSNGVHLDLVLPASALEKAWPESRQLEQLLPHGTNDYLAFGWGDKGFFLETPTWADLKWSTATKSLFWPTPTAMHVSAYRSAPIAGKQVRPLVLNEAEFAKLCRFIQRGFQLNQQQKFQPISCCDYPGVRDLFFEANGSYQLFYTCNSWANHALKDCGVKTARWAPFDRCILHHFPLPERL